MEALNKPEDEEILAAVTPFVFQGSTELFYLSPLLWIISIMEKKVSGVPLETAHIKMRY